MSKQKILEEFDKEFPKDDVYDGGSNAEFIWNKEKNKKIKDFISKALDEQRKEIIEEIESLINSKHCQARKAYHKDSWDAGFHDCLFSISRELLEDYLTINKNNN